MFGSWSDRFFLLCLVGLPLTLVGCQGAAPTGEVSGKITIQGQSPKTKGIQISFLAKNGRIVSEPLKEDGTYRVEGVPAGEAKVAFVFVPPEIAATAGKGRRPLPDAEKGPESKGQAPNPIPETLRDASTSQISVQVVANENTSFNYDIKE